MKGHYEAGESERVEREKHEHRIYKFVIDNALDEGGIYNTAELLMILFDRVTALEKKVEELKHG